MNDNEPIRIPYSQTAIGNMRKLRRTRGFSAQTLATHTADHGTPITRNVIANMETGRQQSMTVDELATIAAALGTTPYGLLGLAPLCAVCDDQPPTGFRCLTCETETP